MNNKAHRLIKLSPRIMSCCLASLMTIQTVPSALAAYKVPDDAFIYAANTAAGVQNEDITTEYHQISDLSQIQDGGTYVIYYSTSKHILYHAANSAETDQVSGKVDAQKLALAQDFDTATQTWRLRKQSNGHYQIESCSKSNTYLDLSSATTSKVPVSSEAQDVEIQKAEDGFTIQKDGFYLAHVKTGQFFVSDQPTSFQIYEQIEVSAVKSNLEAAIAKAEALSLDHFTKDSVRAMDAQLKKAIEVNQGNSDEAEMKRCTTDLLNAMHALMPKEEFLAPTRPDPDSGITEDEPFPRLVNGNAAMRIPALTTLNNGWLAAAIDARWDHCPDGEAIDTLFSISSDNGKTWSYSFPNYFNDSTNFENKYASAFIDPVMVQGKDDTLYLMVDVLPGGTQKITQCAKDTGYRRIGDEMRLVLYTMESGQNTDNWSFYVGDFEEVAGDRKAYAPVLKKNSEEAPAYWVDEHYYLYNADKQPMYCPQLGIENGKAVTDNGLYVHQNVFFYNAALHVRKAAYLWLITSQDNGTTWSAPTILNPQVRSEDLPAADQAYIVGPGAGLCLDDGTIMLPCYSFPTERSSFIYKNPDEDVWHRSDNATPNQSSESTLVQIDENTVRHFYRDGVAELRYTDHTRNTADNTWSAGKPVQLNGIVKATNNQLSSLRYSKKINGKPVILVSTATVSKPRSAGRIYTFNVEDDYKMTLLDTYHVDIVSPEPNQPDSYSYSSLTELPDGRIGLLYEDDKRRGYEHAAYVTFTMEELMPNHQKLELKTGEQKIISNSKGVISKDFDSNVIDVKVEPTLEVKGGQGTIQTSSEAESLAYSLYTVTENNGTYQFAAETRNGTKIWANNIGGEAQIPSKTTPADWQITELGDGSFRLKTDSGYLYFHNDGKNHFDRVTSLDGVSEQCTFQLYRPATSGETFSAELPGFVQVTQKSDITSGGRYLIAAHRNQEVYVLRPSDSSTDKFNHVLKVDPSAAITSTILESNVILTAVASGTTQVKIDNVTYYVTVSTSSGGGGNSSN